MEGIIFDWLGTLYEKDKGLFPGSERVVRELKLRYKLGIVSIAKEGIDGRRKELESSGLFGMFDPVIVDTTKTKEHYIRCMREMGTIPETTIIVDDRTVRGIKIGNQIGCRTFWIQRGRYADETPNEETGEPTYRINSVEDLLDYL